MSINKADCPTKHRKVRTGRIRQKAIEAELEPYFVEGRKEVKSIDNYVYKFQSAPSLQASEQAHATRDV